MKGCVDGTKSGVVTHDPRIATPNCAGAIGKMPCGVSHVDSGRAGSLLAVQPWLVACETWFGGSDAAGASASATLPMTRHAVRVATISRIVI